MKAKSILQKQRDTDILKASALAYINAINSIVVTKLTPVMN